MALLRLRCQGLGWAMERQGLVRGWLRLGCLRDWESRGLVMVLLRVDCPN